MVPGEPTPLELILLARRAVIVKDGDGAIDTVVRLRETQSRAR